MSLPFSTAEFFAVFGAYNEAVWPAQWFLSAAGLLALGGVLVRRDFGARFAYALLGALWVWMALAYHLAQFAAINPAARLFAAGFTLGGALFVWRAARPPAPRLELGASLRGVVGLCLAVFGLAVYPLLNPLLGHHYPAAPGFGLPCPTTIFTLGILSFARPHPERYLLVVPVVWAAIGSTAAFTLGVPQDYVLVLAGGWGVVLLLARRRSVTP